MIGVAIVLVVLGVMLMFLAPWVGWVVGFVGLLLAILWFAGFGRRAARGEHPARRRY